MMTSFSRIRPPLIVHLRSFQLLLKTQPIIDVELTVTTALYSQELPQPLSKVCFLVTEKDSKIISADFAMNMPREQSLRTIHLEYRCLCKRYAPSVRASEKCNESLPRVQAEPDNTAQSMRDFQS